MHVLARPSLARLVQFGVFIACGTAAAAALAAMGSDSFVSGGYTQPSAERGATVWSGTPKTAAASEAEWLERGRAETGQRVTPALASPHTSGTISGTVSGAIIVGGTRPLPPSRLDFGPLEVLDVKPVPASLDMDGDGVAKVLVTARDPATGRTVRVILAADSSVPLARPIRHGL